MRLTVLGCWSPYPRPGESCSGYLLRCGNTNLLLEAGNGSFARLTEHLDFRALAGVVVTHFHPDHYVDLFCLRHAVEGARRSGTMSGPVTLFAPPAPVEVFTKLAGYTGAFTTVNIKDLPAAGENLGYRSARACLGQVELEFVPTTHSLPGYAVLVKWAGKSLFFTGDSAPCATLEKAARGADLMLCESSGLNRDADQLAGIHMTAGQAGALARAAGVKRLVLTHFWPDYDVEELASQAAESFGHSVETAAQGKEFMV